MRDIFPFWVSWLRKLKSYLYLWAPLNFSRKSTFMRKAGISRARPHHRAVPNTVIIARLAKLHLVAHVRVVCTVYVSRLTWRSFPSRRQDAAFSPHRGSRDPIQAPRTRVASLRRDQHNTVSAHASCQPAQPNTGTPSHITTQVCLISRTSLSRTPPSSCRR